MESLIYQEVICHSELKYVASELEIEPLETELKTVLSYILHG